MRTKLGIIVLLLGILVLTYPYIARFANTVETQAIEKEFQKKIEVAEVNQKLIQMKACNEEIATKTVHFNDPFQEINGQLQEERCAAQIFAQDEVMGMLHIPKLELIEPIYEGTTENELSKGVGLLEGTSLPTGGYNNHTVLAGHRGLLTREMFKNLDELVVGDKIIVTTVAGELHYEVYDIRTVEPFETEYLKIQKNEDLLTLFTCTPFLVSTHRLMLHAKRVIE